MGHEADRYRVICHECDPPAIFEAVMIFQHWQHVHGLNFEVYVPTEEDEAALADPAPLSEHALEANADRIEEAYMDRLPFWYRPIARWKMKRLRRSIAQLRDQQISTLLESRGEIYDGPTEI